MVEHIIDPLILESYASRDAVLYASNNNLGKVTVEGDCQVLLKAIMEGPVPPAIHSSVSDIKEIMKRLPSLVFSFIKRAGN